MLLGWTIVAGALCLALWWLLQPLIQHRRRERIAQTPLPAAWRRILRRQVPLYKRLSPAAQQRLESQVQLFCAEKEFHGCAGFEIDEQVQVTIAGHACLLCLQPGAECYSELRSILVYPSAFYVQHDFPDELGLVDETPDLLAGEAWDAGRIILSWEDAQAAVRGAASNVIVHEFAHQLDFDNPVAVGAPALPDYEAWSKVFTREFERLRREPSPVLDDYGATNPAEFFAVVTETFMQRGGMLAEHHPELYGLLAEYFGIETD